MAVARGGGRTWPLAVVLLIVIAAALSGAAWAFQLATAQKEEIDILVRDLAATANERDALQATKQQLESERDDLARSLSDERARVEQAEAATAKLSTSLAEAEASIARLEADLASSGAEAERLNAAVARQRERSEAAQADARGQAATASQLQAAQQRTQQIAGAALSYADAATAVAVTRNRMIQLLRDQIQAERTGRFPAASALVDEFNALIPVHNRQVDEASAALSRLRALL
jgi:chromosome segregation ATPase